MKPTYRNHWKAAKTAKTANAEDRQDALAVFGKGAASDLEAPQTRGECETRTRLEAEEAFLARVRKATARGIRAAGRASRLRRGRGRG